jgi:hypothetical protein
VQPGYCSLQTELRAKTSSRFAFHSAVAAPTTLRRPRHLTRNPRLFDDSYTRWGPIQRMPPETLLALGDHLSQRGWADSEIQAVVGGNFY